MSLDRPIFSSSSDKFVHQMSESGSLVTGSGVFSLSLAIGASPLSDSQVDLVGSLGGSQWVHPRVDSAVASSPLPGVPMHPVVIFRDVLATTTQKSKAISFDGVVDSLEGFVEPTLRDGILGVLFRA